MVLLWNLSPVRQQRLGNRLVPRQPAFAQSGDLRKPVKGRAAEARRGA